MINYIWHMHSATGRPRRLAKAAKQAYSLPRAPEDACQAWPMYIQVPSTFTPCHEAHEPPPPPSRHPALPDFAQCSCLRALLLVPPPLHQQRRASGAAAKASSPTMPLAGAGSGSTASGSARRASSPATVWAASRAQQGARVREWLQVRRAATNAPRRCWGSTLVDLDRQHSARAAASRRQPAPSHAFA